jgi:hypothetical protein
MSLLLLFGSSGGTEEQNTLFVVSAASTAALAGKLIISGGMAVSGQATTITAEAKLVISGTSAAMSAAPQFGVESKELMEAQSSLEAAPARSGLGASERLDLTAAVVGRPQSAFLSSEGPAPISGTLDVAAAPGAASFVAQMPQSQPTPGGWRSSFDPFPYLRQRITITATMNVSARAQRTRITAMHERRTVAGLLAAKPAAAQCSMRVSMRLDGKTPIRVGPPALESTARIMYHPWQYQQLKAELQASREDVEALASAL